MGADRSERDIEEGVFVYPFFQNVLAWSGLRSTVALLRIAALMVALGAIFSRTTSESEGPWAQGVLLAWLLWLGSGEDGRSGVPSFGYGTP